MAGAIAGLKEFGPYAAIELVLPGGSLIAILPWLQQRRQLRRNLPQGVDTYPQSLTADNLSVSGEGGVSQVCAGTPYDWW
jgi:hypothetical protein